jgi:glucose-6-phosphate 1-epimerase
MDITIAQALDMTLEVRNASKSTMQFEEAMHTYLTVGDVQRTTIDGLDNVEYLDKVDGMKRKRQEPGPIQITGETDRVYFNTQSPCVVKDPILGRTITVAKEASNATVVWNPWIAKARAMPDFGDAEWPQMLCVESANALECGVQLEAGKTHRMHTRISVSA